MSRGRVQDALAGLLLTEQVVEILTDSGLASSGAALQWRSFTQMFSSTAGPWAGVGGAAPTPFQVTVASSPDHRTVLVFVETDLLAYGWTDDPWFWDQVRGSSINTFGLARPGLTVLARPLALRGRG